MVLATVNTHNISIKVFHLLFEISDDWTRFLLRIQKSMTSSKTTNLIDMMIKYFYRLNDPITMNGSKTTFERLIVNFQIQILL